MSPRPRRPRRPRARLGLALGAAIVAIALAAPAGGTTTDLGGLTTQSQVASTVPANGDLNPYGVAVVPRTVGNLVRGDILASPP